MRTDIVIAMTGFALAVAGLAATGSPGEDPLPGAGPIIMIMPRTTAWAHPESTTVPFARDAVSGHARGRRGPPAEPMTWRDEIASRARRSRDLAADPGRRAALSACDRALSAFRGERGRAIKQLHAGFLAEATGTLAAGGIAVLATDPLSGMVFVDGARHDVAAVRRLLPRHQVEVAAGFAANCAYANAETRASWLHGLGITGGDGADGGSAFDYLNVDTGVDTTCTDIVVGHDLHGATDPDLFYTPFPPNGLASHGTMTCGIVTSAHPLARGVAPDLGSIFVASNRAPTGIPWPSIEQQIKGYSWGIADTDSLFGDSPEAAHCAVALNVPVYSGFTGYLDAMVDAFDVFLSCSAGNYGWEDRFQVMDAGHAYNAVVVNALVMQQDSLRANTSLAGPVTLNTVGGWGPAADGRKKPDLSVPVDGMWIQDETGATFRCEGAATSFASPQVTGAGLLLMERGVTLPRSLKALMINTAFRPDAMAAAPWEPGYGWGMLDLRHALVHADQGDWFEHTVAAEGRGGDKRYYQGAFMPAGGNGPWDRATLVWEKHVGWSYADTSLAVSPLTDLDLHLYDGASGQLLMSSTSVHDNVEQVWWPSPSDTLRNAILVVDCASDLPAGWDYEPFTLATEEGFRSLAAPKSLVGLQVANKSVDPPQTHREYAVEYWVRLRGAAACGTIRPSLAGLDPNTTVQRGPTPPQLTMAQGDSAVVRYVLYSSTQGERSLTFTAEAAGYGSTWSAGVRTAYTVVADPVQDGGEERGLEVLAVESRDGQTLVRCASQASVPIGLSVFDLRGRKLFECRATPAGPQEVLRWTHRDDRGRKVAAGVYLLRLQTLGRAVTRKVLVVR